MSLHLRRGTRPVDNRSQGHVAVSLPWWGMRTRNQTAESIPGALILDTSLPCAYHSRLPDWPGPSQNLFFAKTDVNMFSSWKVKARPSTRAAQVSGRDLGEQPASCGQKYVFRRPIRDPRACAKADQALVLNFGRLVQKIELRKISRLRDTSVLALCASSRLPPQLRTSLFEPRSNLLDPGLKRAVGT
jgi:hypothetical protein